MTMNGRMPVIAAIKCRCEFPGWSGIRITIQRVTDVVWIFFVDASECEIRKPLGRLGVEASSILGGGIHRENPERGAQDEFHRLIL